MAVVSNLTKKKEAEKWCEAKNALKTVDINVSPTFSYSVNKTYSFTYTPTLPGTIGLFFGGSLDSNFTVVPGSFPFPSAPSHINS